jgi:DNA-binding XRE family transcriptional regulator
VAKKFRDLVKETMSVSQQAAAAAKTAELLAEMPLHELRQARHLSQETLAKILGRGQASVSKIERRTDMYVSTLRGIIEAMGGRLDIVAHFPDGDIRISQFRDLQSRRT